MGVESGYGVVLADPPWRYRCQGNGAAKGHYDTMKVEDICALRVGEIADPDSVLILWATWPCLQEAFEVVRAWGFAYKTGFPWIKMVGEIMPNLFGDIEARPAYGTGYWARGTSEPILIATRGEPEVPYSTFSGLLANRLEHSRKPDDIYQFAEQHAGPYVELFARREREGWDVWGDEVESSVQLRGVR